MSGIGTAEDAEPDLARPHNRRGESALVLCESEFAIFGYTSAVLAIRGYGCVENELCSTELVVFYSQKRQTKDSGGWALGIPNFESKSSCKSSTDC